MRWRSSSECCLLGLLVEAGVLDSDSGALAEREAEALFLRGEVVAAGVGHVEDAEDVLADGDGDVHEGADTLAGDDILVDAGLARGVLDADDFPMDRLVQRAAGVQLAGERIGDGAGVEAPLGAQLEAPCVGVPGEDGALVAFQDLDGDIDEGLEDVFELQGAVERLVSAVEGRHLGGALFHLVEEAGVLGGKRGLARDGAQEGHVLIGWGRSRARSR
ncbi:MAG: hypothetical protein U5Q44_00345 [Dehalococcoidia bacterium]|nr:hypothetical protein [Dehalococcoidia bacterium]